MTEQSSSIAINKYKKVKEVSSLSGYTQGVGAIWEYTPIGSSGLWVLPFGGGGLKVAVVQAFSQVQTSRRAVTTCRPTHCTLLNVPLI